VTLASSILSRLSLSAALVCAALELGACVRSGRPAPDADLGKAAQAVAFDLTQQIGPAKPGTRPLVIDPLLDTRSGQQTEACERVQQALTAAIAETMKNATLVSFNAEEASRTRFVLTGSLTRLEAERYRMSVALSDRNSGLVIAQAAAAFRQAGLSDAPTRFYRDSPSLTRDRSTEGYLRTAETQKGQPADALYIEQLPTAALLAQALESYNAQRWEEALERYNAAVQRKDGQQLRTFNGIYLCNVQLGRSEAAEEAFAKITALGLSTNNLAVKLLFKPGTTEFWPDPKVSGAYPMWLRRIARAVQESGNCLSVVGHTSRSGTDPLNERLSLARATTIRDWLEREAPGLARKSKVSGLGSRENLVGTGADDASDAIDRRVEFKVVPCDG
jgi:outer membrane protein OmpA-like peptidoglycan-associated protein